MSHPVTYVKGQIWNVDEEKCFRLCGSEEKFIELTGRL